MEFFTEMREFDIDIFIDVRHLSRLIILLHVLTAARVLAATTWSTRDTGEITEILQQRLQYRDALKVVNTLYDPEFSNKNLTSKNCNSQIVFVYQL